MRFLVAPDSFKGTFGDAAADVVPATAISSITRAESLEEMRQAGVGLTQKR